jgi:hypothetical protein
VRASPLVETLHMSIWLVASLGSCFGRRVPEIGNQEPSMAENRFVGMSTRNGEARP